MSLPYRAAYRTLGLVVMGLVPWSVGHRHFASMQREPYKRWQQGEVFLQAKKVIKFFLPDGKTSSGLNRKVKEQFVPLDIALKKLISCKKPENETRSIMLSLKCNLPKEHSNGIRGVMNLPVATNSDVKILVIAPPDMADAAKKAGAHIVGGAELIPDIISGKLKFNRCIATPQMVPVIAKMARFLGPLGLMPTIKNGTLTADIAAAVKAAMNNVPFKIERTAGLMHLRVGLLATFQQKELLSNLQTVFRMLKPYGESLKKGKFIESAHICIPSLRAIKIDPQEFN